MTKFVAITNWTRPVEAIQGNGYLCNAIDFDHTDYNKSYVSYDMVLE